MSSYYSYSMNRVVSQQVVYEDAPEKSVRA